MGQEHYFSSKPTTRHDAKTIEVVLRGYKIRLKTDAGVFSKNQVDFGTRLLIECMDIPNGSSVSILDLGCGYGPVGIVAAKLAPDSQVVMVDVNERAIELSAENVRNNQVTNAIVKISDLYQNVQGRTFQRILSNPPIRAGKKVVHQIFEEASNYLTDDGELWIVIQKKQGAPSAKKKLEELFVEVNDIGRDAGYRIFQARGKKQVE
ncbi:class I SAM-dependent methyltransferase [Fodinisporobacter ferrooxydans]|uniref:Class I SAM-dependent methyltransferase n=1 Tax=Fodinisporobacter ferrooxydans TaxID=2901836 RepID=A0ABY4CNH8_9BACL|nr:class I SAM-dependent methyltransferase [Alicyclobacillaceae bacterium MYW30-H2]